MLAMMTSATEDLRLGCTSVWWKYADFVTFRIRTKNNNRWPVPYLHIDQGFKHYFTTTIDKERTVK